MPVYEYECKQCGKRHEIMQRLVDTPLTICSACKGEVYRVISPSGISFKGEGWYITDYARKGQDKGAVKDVDAKKEAPVTAPATGEKKEVAPAPPSTPLPSSPPPSASGPAKDKKE